MNVLIVYNSQHGKTMKYANSIEAQLKKVTPLTKTVSINEFDESDLVGVDHLLLGSWTKGLFIIGQKPDLDWKKFASKLQNLHDIRVSLFTTYGIATGTMFKNMAKAIGMKTSNTHLLLKSKTGMLSEKDKEELLASIY